MRLEFWTPDRQQLKMMIEVWMDEHMGQDWRAVLVVKDEDYALQAILGWPDAAEDSAANALSGVLDGCYFLMTAGVFDRTERNEESTPWGGTMTEQLCYDAWGTALMDCGRELLKDEVQQRMKKAENQGNTGVPAIQNDNKTCIENRRFVLRGPGFDNIPVETMRGLYSALEGWRIGIEINDNAVLLPEKSCGGWIELETGRTKTKEDIQNTNGVIVESCRPGTGCQFCGRRRRCGEKR